MESLLDLLPKQTQISSAVYRSSAYQPERVSLNSQDDILSEIQGTNTQYFSGFTIRLARPCINVKSVQLLRASLPTPVTNLPNTACTFWYFALDDPDETPSESNLRFVRLLPSWTPPELIGYQYGYNRTFTDYNDLVNELNKATINEVLDTQGDLPLPGGTTWISGDIEFNYDSTYNKIQFRGTDETKYYLPASYNDIVIFGTPQRNWIPNFAYAQNALATYNGTVYQALNAVTSSVIPPKDLVNWTLYDSAARTLQLASASPLGLLGDAGEGQPFQNGYSLNLRLGWTWNGVINGNENYKNLIRPVPPYIGIGFDNTTRINTANTYANLVYSNNCYIYLTFIGGSSLDSAGNGNLLAVIPLNTANNAVGFYNNVISNPLTKIPQHISEISVMLKDDEGNDFYLPNSAIVNFELGFTYLQ